jgi:hypothetical protein
MSEHKLNHSFSHIAMDHVESSDSSTAIDAHETEQSLDGI